MESLHLDKENFLNYYLNTDKSRQTKIDFRELIIRLNVKPELINANENVINQAKRLFRIKQIDFDKTPLSTFDLTSFKSFFEQKYELPTQIDTQPLVELVHIETNMNFILRNQMDTDTLVCQEKNARYRQLFIAEHLTVLPFNISQLKVLLMLPALFYRMNSLLKAQKLKNLIQLSISQSLNINQVHF